MNKRIKELAKQANLHDGWFCGNGNIEKFAELIVQECCEWCDAYAADDGTAQKIKAHIKDQFGVK